MIRKNCRSGRDEQLSLLDMQSGHSEKRRNSFFSVVSSKLKVFGEVFSALRSKTTKFFQKTIHSYIFCNIRRGVEKFAMRCCLKLRDTARLVIKFVSDNFVRVFDVVRRELIRSERKIRVLFGRVFQTIVDVYKILKKDYQEHRSLKHVVKTLFELLASKKTVVFDLMNYVYPVVGVIVLMTCVKVISNFEYGLQVDCLGKHIGYIKDEYVFLDASKQMNSRINYTSDQLPINDTPRYTLVKLGKKMKCSTKDDIADRLLKVSCKDKTICEAAGLYINDDLVCVVKNPKSLQEVLNEYIEPYKEQYPVDCVSFVDDVVVKSGYYLTDSLCSCQNIKNKIAGDDEKQIVYTVRTGDVPLMIARDNNISYEQLKQLNPDIEQDLKPGKQLVVSQNKPLLSVKVERERVVEEQIPFETETVNDSNIVSTFCKMIQPGKNGVVEKKYRTTIIDGELVNDEIVSEVMVVEPQNQKWLVGTKCVHKTRADKGAGFKIAGCKLKYPVPGGKISCGWYGYKGHIGVDIAATSGTQIVAAQSGTVIFSGWQGAYGNCVLVRHADGVVTRYAHNSQNLVCAGESVSQGQRIACVGQTGNAHGAHCHFEVLVNGVPQNPTLFWEK